MAAPQDGASGAWANPDVDHTVNVSPVSPLREFASLSLWLALAVVLVVAAIFVGARWLAPFIPFAWEQRVLPQQFMQVSAKEESPTSRQRRVWLQALAGRLQQAMQWPSDISVTVHWVDDDVPNAFATLGGHIFINQGLLERVNSENAVAMVLAHEMAHVLHRDPIVSLAGNLSVGLLWQAVVGSDVTGMVGAGGGITGEAAATLMRLGFSRQQETAADTAALAALQAHYGHLRDADAFFAGMQCEGSFTSAIPEFLQTHPDTDRRVQAIRTRAAASSNAAHPVALPAFMHSRPYKAPCEKE